MGASPLYRVRGGLAAFGPELVRVRELLERQFLTWAAQSGAEVRLYPPLLRVEDLDRLDYFRNFPHLAVVASRLAPEHLAPVYAAGKEKVEAVPAEHLAPGRYALPSAACYGVYLDLEGQVLPDTRCVTTVASCFRNEEAFDQLRRLWGFTMREIVILGTAEAVKGFLEEGKEKVTAFARRLGLDLAVETATDPFFQADGTRALMQKLFPQKQELVYGGSVAIASLNFHRNFFGERCAIRTADGQPAFTGCLAFGIERWLHALLDRFGDDAAAIAAALA